MSSSFTDKCCQENEWVTCADAELFGFCDYEECSGSCTHWGPCSCWCHKEDRPKDEIRAGAERVIVKWLDTLIAEDQEQR